jgi:protein-disulfide isomerase
MKAILTAGAVSLTLLLGACGDGQDNGTATATANQTAPDAPVQPPADGDWTQIVTQTPEGGFRMGNPNAPVKLIEYASITCPACAAFSQEAHEPLKQQYVRGGQVSFEFRNFVLNEPDLLASMAARCQGPEPFFHLVEQLFAEQGQWIEGFSQIDQSQAQQIQSLPPAQRRVAFAKAANLDQFFRRRGMPEARFDACVADDQAAERIAQIIQLGTDQGVGGTPTFFINGQRVDGSNWASVQQAIRGALR